MAKLWESDFIVDISVSKFTLYTFSRQLNEISKTMDIQQ